MPKVAIIYDTDMARYYFDPVADDIDDKTEGDYAEEHTYIVDVTEERYGEMLEVKRRFADLQRSLSKDYLEARTQYEDNMIAKSGWFGVVLPPQPFNPEGEPSFASQITIEDVNRLIEETNAAL